MTRWRWDATLREVAANLLAGLSWYASLTMLAAAAFGTLAFAEGRAAAQALEAADRVARAGRDVVVVSSSDPTATAVVDSAKCQSISEWPSVNAVGGLLELGTAELATDPGTPFRLYGGVGRYATLLDPSELHSGDIKMSQVLAAQLGVRSGDTIDIAGISGVVDLFDPGERHALAALMVVVPTTAERIDECWIEFEPAAREYSSELANFAFLPDVSLSAVSALATDELRETPLEQFQRRSTARWWPVLGLLAAMPMLASVWFARSSVALYRTLGSGRLFAVLIVAIGHCWALTFAALVGLSAGAVALAATFGGSVLVVWPVCVRPVLLAVALGWLMVVLAGAGVGRGRALEQLKDRN